MSKLTDEDIDLIDKFVDIADRSVEQVKHFSGYMKFQGEENEIVTDGLTILHDKIKQMKKAKTLSKLKEVLKVKDGSWL